MTPIRTQVSKVFLLGICAVAGTAGWALQPPAGSMSHLQIGNHSRSLTVLTEILDPTHA